MTLKELTKAAQNWAIAGRPLKTHDLIINEVEATLKELAATCDRIDLAARRTVDERYHCSREQR